MKTRRKETKHRFGYMIADEKSFLCVKYEIAFKLRHRYTPMPARIHSTAYVSHGMGTGRSAEKLKTKRANM